jgi:hypothetical protein
MPNQNYLVFNRKAKGIFVILFILLFSIPCHAWEMGENWTKADTVRQATFHPDGWCELNPIIGSHPSVAKVDTYFAGCLVAHTLIAVALPPKYRKIWQYTWIGLRPDLWYGICRQGLNGSFNLSQTITYLREFM